MVNNVVLVGRLTKDPILRRTQNGTSTASFTVACDKRDKNGNQSADFINCVCWGKVAENTATYTHKGSLIGVAGRIQTRNSDDQSGKKVYVTEVLANQIHFLEPKQSNSAQPNTNTYGQANNSNTSFNARLNQEVSESFDVNLLDNQVSDEDLPCY